MKELIFKKIENSTIFATDYRNFCINNTIQFSDSGMAVVYGPNGTGKTSFIMQIVKTLCNLLVILYVLR